MNEDIEGFSEVSTDEIGEIENLIDIIEDAQESFKKLRHTMLEMKILGLQAEIGDIKGD